MPELQQLLGAVALTEAILLTVLVCGLFSVTLAATRRRRRQQRQQVRLLEELLGGRPGTDSGTNQAEHHRGRTRSISIRAAMTIASELGGRALDRFALICREIGLTRLAEQWCQSRRWHRRVRGVRALSAVGDVVNEPMLADTHPEVRAAAATWVTVHPSPAGTAHLLHMLNDPDPRCRFSAKDALIRIGPQATDRLIAYLETATGEQAAAALDIACTIADPALQPVGLVHCRRGTPAIRTRAATLLTAIGGPDAVTELEHLLGDSDAAVRAAAAHGLGVLSYGPAAPRLATAMRDGEWEVRRSAALSLRCLGQRGRLYLQRTVRGGDMFAADLARQILDLPESAEVWTP